MLCRLFTPTYNAMKTETIYVFAKWQVQQGQLHKVLPLLAQAAQASRQEPGNLGYLAHQSQTDDHTILLYERYSNAEALEQHRNSTHFQQVVEQQIVPLRETRAVTIASLVNNF